MPKDPFLSWQREFRNDAMADGLSLFRDHLRSLHLPDKPKLLLEGTILVVLATCIYLNMDGRPYSDFLRLQKYAPKDAPLAKYAFTFELGTKSLARVLVKDACGSGLDLADLYGHPWNKYKIAGYHRFWVSRTNGKSLTKRQRMKIEDEVIYDLYFDYCEEELIVRFDDDTIKGMLCVDLVDVDY